jgi:HPt (histidine-containing phosphotransfer) domain-containing protein
VTQRQTAMRIDRVSGEEVRGAAPPQMPVDLTHLRRFTLGNVALEREVLELFVEQAPKTLERMQLAQTERAWRDAAHTLKGSAAAIGATAIARTAAEAEQLKCDPRSWPEMLERLRLALVDARSFISTSAAHTA